MNDRGVDGVEELLGELVRGGSGGHGRRLGAGGDGGGGRRLCCGVACADSSPGSGALFLDGLAGAGRLTPPNLPANAHSV